jgi:putative phosphoesterase
MRIGVISDTHGLLRPEALTALKGSDHILHGGDIGSAEVLAALQAIAPVTAVRGNNDVAAWAAELPTSVTLALSGVRIYILHDLSELELDLRTADVRVVISGHSHRPKVDKHDGILYFNPGAAGPRRFKLPVTVGRLTLCGDDMAAEVIDLL